MYTLYTYTYGVHVSMYTVYIHYGVYIQYISIMDIYCEREERYEEIIDKPHGCRPAP
jgi:hypothetical protein